MGVNKQTWLAIQDYTSITPSSQLTYTHWIAHPENPKRNILAARRQLTHPILIRFLYGLICTTLYSQYFLKNHQTSIYMYINRNQRILGAYTSYTLQPRRPQSSDPVLKEVPATLGASEHSESTLAARWRFSRCVASSATSLTDSWPKTFISTNM